MMTIASTLGWFSRIVTLTIELDGPTVLDDGEEFIIPWDSFTGKVNVFDIKGNVSGRVKIVVMEGLKVWHSGIVLNIEQYLHYLDPFVSSDLCAREMKVVIDTDSIGGAGGAGRAGGGGWLEGTVYVNFSIPLDRQYSDVDCYASYTGGGSGRGGGMGDVMSGQNSSNNGSSSSNNNSVGQGGGSAGSRSCSYTVKDTILSPSTSGKTNIVNNGSGNYGPSPRSTKSNDSSKGLLAGANSNRNTGTNNSNIGDRNYSNNISGEYSPHNLNGNHSGNSNTDSHIGSINGTFGSSATSDNCSSSSLGARDVCRWIPTYVGEAFGLRHSIMVTLCRPWYAHSPELCIPLKLYGIVHEGAGRGAEGGDDEEDDSYDNPKPLHLSVIDFSGLCVLAIPSQWVDLDKPVTAKVSLRDYTVPVVSMHLLLLRTEYIHDAHKDTIIFVHRVFGHTPQELLEAIPEDALHTSGYVAREDYDDPPPSETPPGYEIRNTPLRSAPRGGDDPVCSGDGACATFLFDFPMGNDPHSLNGGMNGEGQSPRTPYTPHTPGTARTTASTSASSTYSNSPTSSSSSSPRPDSPTPGSSPRRDADGGVGGVDPGPNSSMSYRERVQRQREVEVEVERRRARLYASFESCQQEGDPFCLHVPTDSDDESDEGEEEGESDSDLADRESAREREREKERAKLREGSAREGLGQGAGAGEDVSGIELGDLRLQDLSLTDPEGGVRGGGGGGGGKADTDRSMGTSLDDQDEFDRAAQFMRRQHKENQRAIRAAAKKKNKTKPYFDFLGDSVSVRYFFRLVVEDGDGECKWNTSEIVLFRSKAPCNSTNMSIVESAGDTSYEMTAV